MNKHIEILASFFNENSNLKCNIHRFSPRQFTVRLGDYDLTKTDDPSSPESFRVIKIKAHESFNGVGFYNDVALLELDREVDYSRYISPICLPQGRSRLNNFVGTYPTVLGWGM